MRTIGALLACGFFFLAACDRDQGRSAPGAPGAPSFWSYAGKTGIGTSYEAYRDGAYGDNPATGAVSRVWYSLAQGMVTEVMYGLIHQAQIKDIRIAVADGSHVVTETSGMTHSTGYLHTDGAGRPLSPAYSILSRDQDGRFELEKHVFSDPDRDVLFLRLILRPAVPGLRAYLIVDPHMANTGGGDTDAATPDALYAEDAGVHLAVRARQGFAAASIGFAGVSDGPSDLADNGVMDWRYGDTGGARGNVVLTAALPATNDGPQVFDVAIGFASTRAAADRAAQASLDAGYEEVLAKFNGVGADVGWEDYLASLDALAGLADTAGDGGRLLHISALVLKTQEDKTHAGALIASLSNPWGDTVSADVSSTGYKAVWPRDFYQCAMALLALGDRQTPLVAFEYLQRVQVTKDMPGYRGTPGWFLQKTHVDGTPEWVAVQLDQTAMPIMLGWKLWQAGLLDQARLAHWYAAMLRPAADFLAAGGQVAIGSNVARVTPPATQQERWEEQAGYSPSTTAAVIAGLISAAEIADALGDAPAAGTYRAAADRYAAAIERTMFTTQGPLGDGRYFLRITENDDPNDGGTLAKSNGREGMAEGLVVDAGFLELVRYGVRAPDAPSIRESLDEIDDTARADRLRLKYVFAGGVPGWRRYGNDGYGENLVDGSAYDQGASPTLRGRVWPFFTGERGHYELAHALGDGVLEDTERQAVRRTYVVGMEYFANEGGMLPEQVWDGVGGNQRYGFRTGQGTNAATPLAWTHAEYVKLVRSLHDGAVWDFYPPVAARYGAAQR
ncbi:MAG: glucan 1,4-alpha-glucosidase [Alphaproteobacteria bacterium]|nr:MAG: glucan 1,4-alpha-glucosidase [Alphaproteobacteria bacterium]